MKQADQEQQGDEQVDVAVPDVQGREPEAEAEAVIAASRKIIVRQQAQVWHEPDERAPTTSTTTNPTAKSIADRHRWPRWGYSRGKYTFEIRLSLATVLDDAFWSGDREEQPRHHPESANNG